MSETVKRVNGAGEAMDWLDDMFRETEKLVGDFVEQAARDGMLDVLGDSEAVNEAAAQAIRCLLMSGVQAMLGSMLGSIEGADSARETQADIAFAEKLAEGLEQLRLLAASVVRDAFLTMKAMEEGGEGE